MKGLEYISKTFGVSYSEIAKRLGVSRGLVNLWINNDRDIPQKRLEELTQIQEFKGIPKVYFSKELSSSEQMEIQIIKLEREDISYEVPIYDNEGVEIGWEKRFENETIINHFRKQIERAKSIEKLNTEINKLVTNDEVEDEVNLHIKHRTDNLDALLNTTRVLKSDNSQQKEALKLILNVFDIDNYEIEDETMASFIDDTFISRFVPNGKKKLAQDLIRILLEHKIITSQNLNSYCNKKE
ncbi:transcriptional regulator with XRE-family HTH domain [Priestia aryabhattai]|uniref:hypothetical protein n=1 Tax=Priestia aryabhattai TaxID=412384 RepID=UPI0027E487CA|nr:hypothetical protein [Priestia aryabhattai]MDP9727049.1 transcriptional regulator with XRE-family HTH domain [Priestia aryabhattai]